RLLAQLLDRLSLGRNLAAPVAVWGVAIYQDYFVTERLGELDCVTKRRLGGVRPVVPDNYLAHQTVPSVCHDRGLALDRPLEDPRVGCLPLSLEELRVGDVRDDHHDETGQERTDADRHRGADSQEAA